MTFDNEFSVRIDGKNFTCGTRRCKNGHIYYVENPSGKAYDAFYRSENKASNFKKVKSTDYYKLYSIALEQKTKEYKDKFLNICLNGSLDDIQISEGEYDRLSVKNGIEYDVYRNLDFNEIKSEAKKK